MNQLEGRSDRVTAVPSWTGWGTNLSAQGTRKTVTREQTHEIGSKDWLSRVESLPAQGTNTLL